MKRLCLVFLMLSVCNAFSDSMSIQSFAEIRAAMPMANADVEMVAESVLIVPAATAGPRNYHEYSMQVTCVFHLRNLTSKHLRIEIGFPFETFDPMDSRHEFEGRFRHRNDMLQFVDSPDPADSRLPEWLDFRAFANGSELTVQYLKGIPDVDNRLLFWPLIAAWEMEFKPGETVRLVNTYYTKWDYISYREWECHDVSYIVRSGSYWNGSIGNAVIQLVVPEELPLPYIGRDCGAWWEWTGSPSIEGRTVTWSYADWHPDQDLGVKIVQSNISAFECFQEHAFDPSPIVWTREGLVPSLKQVMRLRYLYPPMSNESVAKFAMAALRALSGLEDPDTSWPRGSDSHLYYSFPGDRDDNAGLFFLAGSHPFDASRFDLIDAWKEDLALYRETIMNSHFEGFLPHLSYRRVWSHANLSMYSADPSAQIEYLLMLENLEPALLGHPLGDPRMAALYELAGWYVEGHPFEFVVRPHHVMFYSSSLPGDAILERRRVREFWHNGGGCGVPLICASLDEEKEPVAIRLAIAATSELPALHGLSYHAENLIDGNFETAWVEGAEGHGYGESVIMTVLENFDLSGFSFLNGYAGNADTWNRNGRIAKLVVSLNGSPMFVAELLDDDRPQSLDMIEGCSLRKGDILELAILEVYPGSAYSDTALSELLLN